MLNKEQKIKLVSTLLNCKIIYGSHPMLLKKASNVSRLKKLLEFCDPEKLHWDNVKGETFYYVTEISPIDFIYIVNQLTVRKR